MTSIDMYTKAHEEFLVLNFKSNTTFTTTKGSFSGIRTKHFTENYHKVEHICNKYHIQLNLDNIREVCWRLTNNDFSKKLCSHCLTDTVNFRDDHKIWYRFCSTSCSTQHRDNSTRKGFATIDGRIKALETIQDRYGVQHQSHIPEVFEKTQNSRYKTYSLLSPSNKECRVQGYERFVVPKLWETYGEMDVIINKKEIPKIYYFYNRRRKYYPDAFVRSTNTIIEVKSTYTIKCELLIPKMESCISLGYNIKVYLYDKGKTRILSLNDVKNMILN